MMPSKLQSMFISGLKKCKTWGGSLTDVTELEQIVINSEDDQSLKSVLRTEISLHSFLTTKKCFGFFFLDLSIFALR